MNCRTPPSVHKVNGAVGVLVGRAPPALDPHADLYDADLPEHTVFLMDWMHVDAEYVFPGLHNPLGQSPVSMLINGRGNYQLDNGTWTRTPLTVFRVQRGLRYRFRIINSGGLSCPLALRVHGHRMTIIASDSRDVQPLEVDTLYTFSGERYDVVVSADQQEGGAFWVHSYAVNCTGPAEQAALLIYEGSPEGAEPNEPRPSTRSGTQQPEGVVMNSPGCFSRGPDQKCTTDLQSLDAIDDPLMLGTAEPEERVVQEVLFHGYTNQELFLSGHYPHFLTFGRNIAGTIGNVSFMMPRTPLLTQPGEAPTCEGCAPGEEFCICTHLLRVSLGAHFEIVLVDATNGKEAFTMSCARGRRGVQMLRALISVNEPSSELLDHYV
ncbi:Laccase-3 [Frankliniella fusca]|uniref:Laccase-3 n=1 Tax=Frankliniella fusca TaxID=407009 RepID=A0AAE1GRG7_9NEOP|nr:Laccase-3 [Frankliniella fusca]